MEHKKKIDGLEGGRVFSGTLSKNISDEIFISGSFIGIARFDNITVSSNGTMDDLFVSKLSALTFTGNNTMTLYKDFKLYQNYPNPFNPKTNIEYSLEEDQYVRLKIFDLNGKEVAEPVSLMQKAGNHKIMFDGSSLSSGIYFYTIVSGKQFQTRTMILLK